MTKLTKFQHALLSSAAQTPDGPIERTEENRTTAASLIKRGLMISLPSADGPSRLLITERGRAAIGAPSPQAAQKRPTLPAEGQAAGTAGPNGKLGTLVTLLGQGGGAMIEAMQAATGWQAHSVRGAIAGAIKKRGFTVYSEKAASGRVYRIEKGAGA
jgi:hypothetical protein